MIMGTSYGFEPNKIIDVKVDDIVMYKWTQSDIVRAMIDTDNNMYDRYKVCSIRSVIKLRHHLYSNYGSVDSGTFMVRFVKEGISNGYDGTTHINILNMVSKMREIKLRRVVGEKGESNGGI
jgi:hypothetical protein